MVNLITTIFDWIGQLVSTYLDLEIYDGFKVKHILIFIFLYGTIVNFFIWFKKRKGNSKKGIDE